MLRFQLQLENDAGCSKSGYVTETFSGFDAYAYVCVYNSTATYAAMHLHLICEKEYLTL